MSNVINRVFLGEHNEIISMISAIPEILELNKLSGRWVDVDQFPELSSFWSGSAFVCINEKPTPNCTFDYVQKKWVDLRTLEQIKDQKWIEAKQQRDAAEYGGFAFNGLVFDSDTISQGRIITAAQLGRDVEWTLKDNSVIRLSAHELFGLQAALAQHISSCHERGRIVRQLIYDAETVNEIDQINY